MAKYELTGRPSTSKASKQASHLLCSTHTALPSVVQIQGKISSFCQLQQQKGACHDMLNQP
jgi:hypothetical protein